MDLASPLAETLYQLMSVTAFMRRSAFVSINNAMPLSACVFLKLCFLPSSGRRCFRRLFDINEKYFSDKESYC